MGRVESKFQAKLVKELRVLFPGCIVLKNDSQHVDDIPDLLILFGDRWGALECKSYEDAEKQPNQGWYVEKMNRMSFAAFIHPGNKERVLNELQLALGPRGETRVPQSV
jgi:hypothetical protein